MDDNFTVDLSQDVEPLFRLDGSTMNSNSSLASSSSSLSDLSDSGRRRRYDSVVDLTESDGEETVRSLRAKRPRRQDDFIMQPITPAVPHLSTEDIVSEVRAAPLRRKVPKAMLESISKAQRERMYIIQQRPVKPESFEREFVLLGTTGNVYNVNISKKPSCTCAENKNGQSKYNCKHIIFVLLRLFKVDNSDPSIYQEALLKRELSSIFSKYTGTTGVMADSIVTEKYLELTSSERRRKPRKEVPRKPIDTDCPICMEKMKPNETLVYCKYSCGQNIHKACFDKWQRTKNESNSEEMKCIYCRRRWDSEDAKSVHIKNGYLNLAEYQDRHPTGGIPPYFLILPELLRMSSLSSVSRFVEAFSRLQDRERERDQRGSDSSSSGTDEEYISDSD